MTCFGELFARYREKIYDLLEQEASDDDRAYCCIPSAEDASCFLCVRHAFNHGRDWNELCRTCDSEQCRELWAWYELGGKEGSKRRKAFKERFDEEIWDMDHSMRINALLIAMLTIEIREADARIKRQLVVA